MEYRLFFKKLKKSRMLLIMFLFPLSYYLIFKYIPMLGIIIGFEDYRYTSGIFKSEWVWFKHFINFFESRDFLRVIRNTILINIYDIIFSFPIPIILAISINEARNRIFKRVVQTVSYFPHFISTVIIIGLAMNFLSPTGGWINRIIVEIFKRDAISFLMEPKYFRGIYVATSIWQHAGWSSILYLASLVNIDVQLYEAAYVDGANKWKQLMHITLPCLVPTIFTLLIIRMGYMFSVGFDKIILMYNPLTYEVADVIDTLVYRRGIEEAADFSYATAIGFFKSIISFILVVIANKLSGRYADTSIY